ncbi:MAG: hypothetical protein KDD66_13675 [Bdellovibrionales bacterium]|nr:hypothetical protein [Planctomycetales bacterium]MCB0346162.1 hypothetical protein [Bdellovibrionales bacterium]
MQWIEATESLCEFLEIAATGEDISPSLVLESLEQLAGICALAEPFVDATTPNWFKICGEIAEKFERFARDEYGDPDEVPAMQAVIRQMGAIAQRHADSQ